MHNLTGGYIIHKVPAILRGVNGHTAELKGEPISRSDLQASNLMQATGWAVNRAIHGIAAQMLAERSSIFAGSRWPVAHPDEVAHPVPPRTVLAAPEKTEEAAWAGFTEDQKRQVRARNARIYRENDGRRGKRSVFEQAVGTADIMEAHARFYFVTRMDFRLRRYIDACGGLTPQGSDVQKALLQFADPVALGATGYYWLCVRAASCYGLDKLPLDDRMGWAVSNGALFEEIARDPMRWEAWWTRRDAGHEGEPVEEPWGFLATALELAEANKIGDRGDYLSHLSVPLDGTANGLQHLSAMGLDPVGAMATNLCAGVARQDPYIEVADVANEIVNGDAARGLAAALAWQGQIGRKTVKRTVLATPYGITEGGIQKGLINEGLVPESDTVGIKESSAYFRDVLVMALATKVGGARRIMAWMQESAERMAEAQHPMDWTTPMGSTLRQAYYETTRRQIDTLVGKVRVGQVVLHEEIVGGRLDPTKQALGSAPQIVHSFDAAHLAATVNLCGKLGVRDFSMIHDSFGTHAGKTGIMSAALRQTFVDQYRVNWLDRLAEGWRATGVDISDPPARGDFDLDQVLNAEFFFS